MHRRHSRPARRSGRLAGLIVATLVAVAVVVGLVTVLRRPDPAPSSAAGPTATATPTVVPTTTPPPPPPPRVTPQDTVNNAAAVGKARGARVGVAVLDRQTGAVYVAGEPDAPYPTASLVKTFIATRLLVDGLATDTATRDLMWKMIVASDDAAASALYPKAGGGNLAAWIVKRYGVKGLSTTTRSGAWGLTQVTARAMVTFYAGVAKDPLAGPWLLDAMAHMQPAGSDGWSQRYGIPEATQSWRAKQGWLCCVDEKSRMHSTGFVNDDRYAVALLTESPRSTYGEVATTTLTLMAQALLPGGSFPTLP